MKFTMQNTIFMLFYKLEAEKDRTNNKKSCILNWLIFDPYKITFFLVFFLKSSVNGWRCRFAAIRRYLASSSCPLANKCTGAKGRFKRPFFVNLCFCVVFSYLKFVYYHSLFFYQVMEISISYEFFFYFPWLCSLIFMDVYLAVQL